MNRDSTLEALRWYESLEIALHHLLVSLDSKTFDTILSQYHFTETQIGFLGGFRPLATQSSPIDFCTALYEHRNEISLIIPGYIHILDDAALESPSIEVEFYQLIKGKRVVIVGPGSHLIGSGQGGLIDRYDLVVRLNHMWPMDEGLHQDLGSKMDVLYHCANSDFDVRGLFTKEFKDTLFICHEIGIQTSQLLSSAHDFSIPTLNVTPTYLTLARICRTCPNTGTAAIYHLLGGDIRELYITGMTFFQEPYYPTYRGKGNQNRHWQNGKSPSQIGSHAIDRQNEFLAPLLRNDPRVRLDKKLKEILSSQPQSTPDLTDGAYRPEPQLD